MKPSQLAARLRRIASAIEASKTPSRVLVARDLKRTLAALDGQVEIHLTRKGDAQFPEDQDGSTDVEIQEILSEVGATVPHWEGDTMLISVDAANKAAVDSLIQQMQAGQHGPAVQAVMSAYEAA